MLSESQRLTWFQIQGHHAIACTKTGCGPGGPLADLMYNIAMLPAIQEIDQQMIQLGHAFRFHVDNNLFSAAGHHAQQRGPISQSAVTAFVDDLSGTAPLDIRTCNSRDMLEERIGDFVRVFMHALHKRGMILNTKPGKSAIKISIAGQNSCKVGRWIDLFDGRIDIDGFIFQVVHLYKLLGGVIEASASLGPEMSSRQLAVTKISAPYHRYVSTKVLMSMSKSVRTVDSMVVSSLLYNAHTWCNMTDSQLHQIDSRLSTAYGLCIPYKLMYLGEGDKFRRLTNQQIFLSLACPTPTGSCGIVGCFFCLAYCEQHLTLFYVSWMLL